MGDPQTTSIPAAIERTLAERGPLTEEQLLSALDRAGLDLGDDPAETLSEVLDFDVDQVDQLADERWMSLPTLLADRIFTHRLDAREIEYDLLDTNPDLVAHAALAETEEYSQLADGSELIAVTPFDANLVYERGVPLDALAEHGGLLLGGGRLRAMGLAAGDLVGLRLTAAGLQLEVVDDSGAASGSADLGRCLSAILNPDSDEPEQLDTAIWTACAKDPALFRQPMAPLGQSLDELGLTRDGPWLADATFDFDQWHIESTVRSIGSRYELTEDEALAVLTTVTMYKQVAELHAAALADEESWDDEEESGDAAALESWDDDALQESADPTAQATADPIARQSPNGVAQLTADPAAHQTADASAQQSDDPTAPQESDPEFTTRPAPAAPAPGAPAPAAAAQRGAAERKLVRATLEFLAEPAVAAAVLEETGTSDGMGAAALGMFAEALEPTAPRAARPALRWLQAKAYERLGEVTDAEATYRAAETLDPAWPLTLLDLARYASDRGDASRGLALLRRAGAPPEHELVELLEQFEAKPRTDLGRNQQCWCGSGRKYKQCHLHREQLPLAERAAWLYQKAGMFLVGGAWREDLFDAAGERSQFSDADDAFIDALEDPLVSDVVLFEGGAFADFVAERGGLLPDDERLLAEQWLLAERSLYEVQTVRRGEGIVVRDLRTGDIHDVRERSASRQLKAGDLICARIVPAGTTMQIFGGVEPVALRERDELIELLDSEPDPLELVAFLTRRFAPVALQNTEGEPTVLCEATLRVPDAAALSKSLDEAYPRDEDDTDPAQWLEYVTTHGMRRIRATLQLDGEELHVHTNSTARFERVLDTLRALEPAITVLHESRQPATDMAAAMRSGPGATEAGLSTTDQLDPGDPEVAAVLDQVARQYEQNWLDESIPALAGRTPRECAADPTRRPDLIRLLDSFPAADGNPGAMSPDRLRAALDLP